MAIVFVICSQYLLSTRNNTSRSHHMNQTHESVAIPIRSHPYFPNWSLITDFHENFHRISPYISIYFHIFTIEKEKLRPKISEIFSENSEKNLVKQLMATQSFQPSQKVKKYFLIIIINYYSFHWIIMQKVLKKCWNTPEILNSGL